MVDISASAVKSLRERTGLPLMECKQALQESGGDEDAAVALLRTKGAKTQALRSGRETSAGRIGVYIDSAKRVSAMVEVQCESAPVANSPEFIKFVDEVARQLAQGPGAKTPEELLKQPAPDHPGQTLEEVKNDMFNRIREVFNVSRIVRIDGDSAGYGHHTGTTGVLVEFSGSKADVAREIAMHVAAMKPKVLNTADLDPKLVEREREILSAAARTEGKPENIIEKMVQGRMKNFYAECVLAEQPFVKDDKKTVGKVASENGLSLIRYIHWELGKE